MFWLAFIPLIAVLALLFGIYYLIIAVKGLAMGGGFASGLLLVHGSMGLLMSGVLWREYRKFRRRMRERKSETSGE